MAASKLHDPLLALEVGPPASPIAVGFGGAINGGGDFDGPDGGLLGDLDRDEVADAETEGSVHSGGGGGGRPHGGSDGAGLLGTAAPRSGWAAFWSSPATAVVVCSSLLCGSFADRSVSVGAFQQMQDFLAADLNIVNVNQQYGALSAAAVAGYAVSAVVCGMLANRINHFRIITVAACVLAGAVVLTYVCAR